MVYTYVDVSEVGRLLVAGDEEGIRRISFDGGRSENLPEPSWREDGEAMREAVEQLEAYFAGTLTEFDLPLALEGSPFQKRVWEALREIPYGSTISYGELARRVGSPNASRAVGAANGRNPLPIVIPCHRVIGSDGKLTGFGGGLPVKQALLELERRTAGGQSSLPGLR